MNFSDYKNSYLHCWGFGKYGQIGREFMNYSLFPFSTTITYENSEDYIKQIYSGENHNAILTNYSSIYTYGKNIFGQLGHNNNSYIASPTLLKMPSQKFKINEISLGGEHTLMKTENGLLYAFGLNLFGQLGTGDNINRLSPTKININSLNENSEEEINYISAGAQHSVICTNKNRLFSCGFGKNGSLGLSANEDVNIFTLIDNNNNYNEIFQNCKTGVSKLVSGVYHTCCVVNNNREIIIWGNGDVLKYHEPTLINIYSNIGSQIKDVKIGDDFILLLSKDDQVYSWGSNSKGQLGIGTLSNNLNISKINVNNRVEQISAGYEHCIVLTNNREVYGWGSNEYGQLGLNDNEIFTLPVPIIKFNELDPLKIQCGGYHSIGLFKKKSKDEIYDNELFHIYNKKKEILNRVKNCFNPNNNNNTKKSIDDCFNNILRNISRMSLGISDDYPFISEKINLIDSIQNKVNDLKEQSKELDAKLLESKEKEKQLGFASSTSLAKLSRGFDNSFEIDVNEIIFDKKNSDIGKGTFGEVRRGIWRGEEVAVKFLKTSMLTSNESITAFVEECNILKNLHHPNVLLYMGANTKGPDFFVVTEFCENGNLFEFLHLKKNQKLGWEDIRRIALEISYGVNYLHSFNPPILHRDLKSMNVLLDKNFQVKLADFGNTKYLDVQMTKQKGTFQWMAPEVIRGNVYTEKSDVFSFGIIMNELVTRVPPYQGVDKREVARKVLAKHDYRPALPKRIPKDWHDLMVRCYDYSEKKRPNFNEIIDCLKKAKLQ